MRALLATCVLLASTPAMAQPIFTNPFADAAVYRRERADLTEANFRLRYEAARTEGSGAPVVSELIIDVAADWSLARQGETSLLRDFRLNRTFVLSGDRFTTMNGLAVLAFRVMERQNRTFLQRMMAAAGAQAQSNDDCDADAELGLALPRTPNRSATEFRGRGRSLTLICAGREIGGFTAGDGAAPPPAFWPTVFDQMPIHPALHTRVRATGRAPARLETSFRFGSVKGSSWRLLAVETVAQPYPLLETMRNATAEQLDELLGAGGAQLATDAVAGRAQGGAPTLQSWGEHLASVSRREGIAAAAMLLMPTYNMFPEFADMSCDGARQHQLCQVLADFRANVRSDPAPMALMEVGMAEQNGDSAAAISAMQRAQASRLKDHPALGASFALALMRFNDEDMKRVRDAGLPTDIAALQARAIRALPYNPAYWTDFGDRLGAAYQWPDALLFYDIAFSLPMPQAINGNRALKAKRDFMERIRRDFPEASLPH